MAGKKKEAQKAEKAAKKAKNKAQRAAKRAKKGESAPLTSSEKTQRVSGYEVGVYYRKKRRKK